MKFFLIVLLAVGLTVSVVVVGAFLAAIYTGKMKLR